LKLRDVVFIDIVGEYMILLIEHPGLLSPIAAGNPTALRTPKYTKSVWNQAMALGPTSNDSDSPLSAVSALQLQMFA
jgi:hypothetical protein